MQKVWKTPEDKARLIKHLTDVIEEDILSDEDMLTILQICNNACARKQAELTEDIMVELINGGDET